MFTLLPNALQDSVSADAHLTFLHQCDECAERSGLYQQHRALRVYHIPYSNTNAVQPPVDLGVPQRLRLVLLRAIYNHERFRHR